MGQPVWELTWSRKEWENGQHKAVLTRLQHLLLWMCLKGSDTDEDVQWVGSCDRFCLVSFSPKHSLERDAFYQLTSTYVKSKTVVLRCFNRSVHGRECWPRLFCKLLSGIGVELQLFSAQSGTKTREHIWSEFAGLNSDSGWKHGDGQGLETSSDIPDCLKHWEPSPCSSISCCQRLDPLLSVLFIVKAAKLLLSGTKVL